MSPSILPDRADMAFFEIKVCTCGIWIARTAARKMAVTATNASHIIFSIFFIALYILCELTKIVKLSDKCRIFALR